MTTTAVYEQVRQQDIIERSECAEVAANMYIYPVTFDEALDQILWWIGRENEKDTLVSLGLNVRVLFGPCKNDNKEQWATWSGEDWNWPGRFICPGCGNHWVVAERYEDWPFKS